MTRTIGVTMVRDEADIVGATIEHMLEQCDAIIVADNLSTDATPDILAELAERHGTDRLVVATDDDPAYYQSRKITALALRARLELAADWIVPFDADEWWYSPFGPRIADVLAGVQAQWLVVPANVYDHVATGADSRNPDPTKRIQWRRQDALGLPKVACRWRVDMVIEQGNHGAYYDGGPSTFDRLLVVRHFPYRSVEQFVRKVRNGAAAYRAMADVGADVGTHWRQWGDILDAQGEDAVAEIFRLWYFQGNPREQIERDGEQVPPLVWDPVHAP